MAYSRNQGSVLCFCAALQDEGMSIPAAVAEEMRIADCLKEDDEEAVDAGRRQKKRELFLCLPPSAASAATSDAYSPRSLISRLLHPLRWPSPARYGGSVEQGVGCRLPFPKCVSGGRKGRERRLEERLDKAEVDDGAKVAKEPAGGGVSEACARMGRENSCTDSSPEVAIVSGKKKDEVPLNLGMGVGLVFLLARSATEISKMVELREQMEILLRDVKDNVQKKDVSYSTAASSNPSPSVSDNSRDHQNLSKEVASYAIARAPAAARGCLEMDQMEAELQVELDRLQCAIGGAKGSSLVRNQPENESVPECFSDESSEDGYEHCGVSAHELTKRLNQLLEARQQEGLAELESSFDDNVDLDDNRSEVTGEGEEAGAKREGSSNGGGRRLHAFLETRQRERIAELESALRNAEQKIREKEREICRWRNTARLVSLHKKESLNR